MAEFIFQESGPLGLAMKDEDWHVSPGEKITIPALVANRSSDDIFVELSVQGVPMDWVTLDNPVVHLRPKEKHEFALIISPPPYPKTQAGEYPVNIRASVQNQPGITLNVKDTLTIATYRSEGRIGVLLASIQYSVAPGGNIVIPIILVNRGLDTDTFRLSVKGIPPQWISTVTPSVKLTPSESREIEFKITIPRNSETDAGRNSFTIQIISENQPDQKSEVDCIMTVAVFSQFSVSMLAPSIKAGQTGSISIKNEGNAKEAYTVSFEEQAHKLSFEKAVQVPNEKAGTNGAPKFRIEYVAVKEQESIHVEAGETVVFEFRASQYSRGLVGGETILPFMAHVQSIANKQKKSLEGQIISKAYLPVWGVVVILLLLLFCCIFGALTFRNSTQGNAATQTASANQTQAVINGGEDTDGDGISNSDEVQRGTNPQNADSDGDELKDGEEVITYLTDPLKPDTDSDGLSDGEEVITNKTNPILPDTDGDTLTDGNEVQIKTDPLKPDTDGDGLKDGDETRSGTDPLKPDTDNDGLVDGKEGPTCPNWLNPDSDNDGIVDGKDLDPCNPANPSLTANAPTVIPPTTIPPTAIPPTGVPPTAIPPTVPAGGATPTSEPPPHISGTTVFDSNRDGNSEIYSLNMGNYTQARLTNNPAVDMQAVLAPNSQQVLYVSNVSGNNEIYLSGLDRRTPINLTNNPADEQFPSWSPDGNFIAFTTNRDGNNEIYIMKNDGTEVRNLTQNPASDTSPSWFSGPGLLSADEWIAFTTNRDGNNEIYRVRKDGSELSNLTQNIANDYSPSGYGSTIAFVSDRSGNPDIYTMKVDGQSQANITNSPGQDLDPSIGPSNSWIAYSSDRDGNLDIWVIQTNGKGAYNMTKSQGQDRHPSWR
jgi:hypothetical protein